MSHFPSALDHRRPVVAKIASLGCLGVAALVIGVVVPRAASAGLVMKIDTHSNTFFIEGSDTGNAVPMEPTNPFYALQFVHYFATTVPEYAVVTNSLQNLLVQGATLPMTGSMHMTSNFGLNYAFIQFEASSGDITSLTGLGPSAAVSYAGLPAADIPVFESLIGTNFVLTVGTGYSPISVEAVPEPSAYCMALAGTACGGFSMWRRRKRA